MKIIRTITYWLALFSCASVYGAAEAPVTPLQVQRAILSLSENDKLGRLFIHLNAAIFTDGYSTEPLPDFTEGIREVIIFDEQTEENRFFATVLSFITTMLQAYSSAEQTTMPPALFAEIRITSMMKRAVILQMYFVALSNTASESLTALQGQKLNLIIEAFASFIKDMATPFSLPPWLEREAAGGAGAASS